MRYTMLTFDVEEFDMPLEYNQPIGMPEQLQQGMIGLSDLAPLWQKYNCPCTLFTTAHFAQHFPALIKDLSKTHEIGSHTFYHSSFEVADLLQSKKALEDITQQRVHGLRMPRMRNVDMADVLAAGYSYDSSINPTWLPGRYNNLHLSRSIYLQQGMVRVPASVSPHLRIPLFWLGFKNYPYFLFKHLCLQTLRKDGYLSLYFHPWEFTNLSIYDMPGYTKKPDGKILLKRLEKADGRLVSAFYICYHAQLFVVKKAFTHLKIMLCFLR